MTTAYRIIETADRTRLRLTQTGIEHYGPRFARVGIDARKIASRAELEAAADASFMQALHELATETQGASPDLDRILDDLLTPERSG